MSTDRAPSHDDDTIAWKSAIVESSDDAIIGKTLDGTIVSWNAAATELFGYTAEEMVGRPITMLAPPGREGDMPLILDRIRRGERVRRFETERRRKDGTLVPVSLTVSPVYAPDGTIIGASKIARDISDRKAMEERIELLVREIDHRSKNQLSVVCSLLRLTKADSIDAFRKKLEGRIIALGHANGQLGRDEWDGASLPDLAAELLKPFRLDDSRIQLDGPPLTLSRTGVRAISLALHECATNAVKYGALSADAGVVTVRWRTDPERNGDFVLRWTETGGPPPVQPIQRGFGCRIIEFGVRQGGGAIDVDFGPAGVAWTMVLPSRHVRPATA